jgi:hypothetical protein
VGRTVATTGAGIVVSVVATMTDVGSMATAGTGSPSRMIALAAGGEVGGPRVDPREVGLEATAGDRPSTPAEAADGR